MSTDLPPELLERLQLLKDKYDHLGQDLVSYLDGLLYAHSLSYWDYIHLETLLSLQTPRTDFPDEIIFITYHQVTELYFKLIQHELDQLLLENELCSPQAFMRLGRINNYFRHLGASFDVMTFGMDPKQFLRFRMSLLPASGFQTAQYREIEFKITSLRNLVADGERWHLPEHSGFDELYDNVYWKRGGLELATGQKTLTLKLFEQKYDAHFRRLIWAHTANNLHARWKALPPEQAQDPKLLELLRQLDLQANVFWRLSHYKAAARYLQRDPKDIEATGGTNWQQYLPPRFQRIMFFPELWTDEQRREWGKTWVLELFSEQVERNWNQPEGADGAG